MAQSRLPAGVLRGEDGVARCFWAGTAADYVAYHDQEWGVPEADDVRLFEKLCLEGFQSGLSWLTILRKRGNFRRAFAGFDYRRVAGFGAAEVARLLADAGIVRHRGKIESAINNARRTCELVDRHGSLAAWLWRFEPAPRSRPRRLTRAALLRLGSTPASAALSRELKRHGYSFVGPTTAYAFMQAMGLVNDHLEGCDCRPGVEHMRETFRRPV
jgi:DNA-3-methyladenine glycosylase I